ncbi:MAG: translocation/assembly module TamB domain-containing protein, partial [Daejeonella sp.]
MLLIASFIFSLQFKPVQTYVAKKVASYLSGELKTKVEVGSLYIKPFKSLVLEGLYIEDQKKDTLFYSKSFTVDLNLLSLKLRKISVNTVKMDDGKFYLKRYTDKTTNLAFIINYFNTGKPNQKKKPGKPYDITFDKIILNNITFRYRNFNNTTIINGINFNDLDLRNLNSTIVGLDTKTHLLKADFKNLTFKEKSGFYLKNLTTNAIIDKDQMEFKELMLETPDTRLTDYFLMKYSSFKDFQKFVDKVYIKAHFNNARLNSRDIAFFAPKAVGKANMQLDVDGFASGYVKDLKAKDLALKTGQATYLKGDFEIKGLPDIKTTLLNLKFDHLATNKKDIDYLLAKFSSNKKVIIPAIAGKFGDISFKGNFKGFITNFSTDGEFKTRLGRIISDIEFKTDKNNNPFYKGKIQTFDFNLGDLLNQKTLGRTTLTANIDGSGFKLNKLKQQIETKVAYFDFKGYRYTNIELNGEFYNKLFDGQMKINDRNIKLDFKGEVDLNPQLPVFNFNAIVRNANLNALKLTKDTLQIDADFNTNFSGNNLSNIQGRIDINKVRFTSRQKTYIMNSVAVVAEGIGVKRLLTVRSDILDASIEGDYDLNTLPSYFKTIVKRYVPSLQLSIVKPRNQNFEFKLNMKYFEPLSLLLNIPKLKISDQFSLNGKFVSSENVATLSGYAKLIEYDKIKIHNLIVDENATADNLNLFITSDRVDLTDSLFIKNVNIANTLKNDSLSLNIKLSDKDAVNQLDLNSLVEFSSQADSAIKLSLLPSDVIINNEVWRIQEQVRIKFDVGKKPGDKFSLLRRTQIEGFQLFRDNQILTIDGFISKNPEDELLLGFNKFKLTTFNTLTKSLGISLSGTLNGNAKLSAIGKTPRVDAALTIDSLKYNAITIGDLKLAANLDNKTKLIDVKMDIFNQGEKTLDISGTYNSAVEKNNLDIDVIMKDNQLILFQPFIKKLVSNLKGTVSSELKVTGELKNPKIKGTLSLKDAELTVNYLKTPYHITDKVTVDNSIITLKNLIIKDINNNEAKVNGTVDMGNPNNPDININIAATNFMALNTTAKDNPLYYGRAFGTGRFTFNGPTNNMRINIAAKTEDGTVFNIPLNSSTKITDKDFITFVTKDSTLNDKKISSFNGLTMNFDLEVNEKSEVNILTQLGKLTGR